MMYFIVEGTLIAPEKMTDDLLEAHKTYTKQWMEDGRILLSSLKHDLSGGLFIAKTTEEDLLSFLKEEPFAKYGIQTYDIKAIDVHFISQNKW